MNPTSTIIPLLLAEAEPWHAAPWAPHAVALFAFASGIALWLAGRSYLRLTFMFAGAGVGALSGFEAGVAFLPSFNPLLCAGIGLGLGALLGLVAFRFAVAVSLGAVAAVTSALVTLATISVQTAPASEPPPTDLIAASPEAPPPDAGSAPSPWPAIPPLLPDELNNSFVGPVLGDAAADLASQAADRVRTFFAALAEQAEPIWNEIPSERRLAVSGAAVLGLIIGLLAGFLMPSRGAAVATSFIGPAIWLPTGLYLLSALGAPVGAWTPSRPLAWVGLWLGAAVIGLLVQWTRRKPSSDKA